MSAIDSETLVSSLDISASRNAALVKGAGERVASSTNWSLFAQVYTTGCKHTNIHVLALRESLKSFRFSGKGTTSLHCLQQSLW